MTSESFRHFADALPEALLLVRPREGTAVDGNTAARQLLGLPREGAIDERLLDRAQEGSSHVLRYLDLCARTRSRLPGSMTLQHSGQALCLRLDGCAVRSDDEPLVMLQLRVRNAANSSFLAFNHKISELTREIAKRKAAEQLLNRAAIGMAQIDPNGRHVLANDFYCSLLDMGHEQILKTPIQDLIHSGDLPNTIERLIHVLETGSTIRLDFRVERQDGRTIWIGSTVSAIRDGDRVQHLLVLAQDITARKVTERAYDRSRADLSAVINSVAESVYCINRGGQITLCNAAFLRLFGVAHESDIIGKDMQDVVRHARADGVPYTKLDSPLFKTAQSGVHAHMLDDICIRSDGTQIPVECWTRPIVREGEISGAVCTFVDITERKQAEARLQLMNQEMAHRVKNTLAMVQAIVGQSLRNLPAAQAAAKSVNQRLMALGNAHTALTRRRTGTASIMEVVEGAVAVHRAEAERIKTQGPTIDLGAKAALGLTMTLHELCTNAAKYGALSNDAGTVKLEWAVVGGAADARFKMQWKETGGPAVVSPARRGFGSRLIAESIGTDLGVVSPVVV